MLKSHLALSQYFVHYFPQKSLGLGLEANARELNTRTVIFKGVFHEFFNIEDTLSCTSIPPHIEWALRLIFVCRYLAD